jgi:CRP-like cAMP-binding protein
VIVRQGEPADRFYVILAGSFEVVQTEAAGAAPIHLRTMGEDEVFGEIGLLTGSARTATVTATTEGRMLALEAPEFLELVSSAAEVGPRLLAIHRGGAVSG